jgi:hypothetical protein
LDLKQIGRRNSAAGKRKGCAKITGARKKIVVVKKISALQIKNDSERNKGVVSKSIATWKKIGGMKRCATQSV